jgi:hypothetical protein
MALPPEILRILSAYICRDETASNTTLQLMAFCGVCRRWREVGRETKESLVFDSTDTQHGPKTTLAKFKKAPVAHKRDLFQGASRLLTGKLAPGPSALQHITAIVAGKGYLSGRPYHHIYFYDMHVCPHPAAIELLPAVLSGSLGQELQASAMLKHIYVQTLRRLKD